MTVPTRLLSLSALALLASAGTACAGSDPKFAAQKAVEAAYVQTGIRDEVEAAKRMATRAAKDYVHRVNMDKETGFLLGLAQVIRTEQITMRLGNGKTLTLTKVSVSITIPF